MPTQEFIISLRQSIFVHSQMVAFTYQHRQPTTKIDVGDDISVSCSSHKIWNEIMVFVDLCSSVLIDRHLLVGSLNNTTNAEARRKFRITSKYFHILLLCNTRMIYYILVLTLSVLCDIIVEAITCEIIINEHKCRHLFRLPMWPTLSHLVSLSISLALHNLFNVESNNAHDFIFPRKQRIVFVCHHWNCRLCSEKCLCIYIILATTSMR